MGNEPQPSASAHPPTDPQTPATTPDNIDLYCLNCGYNLRGLSGDPRRCPECGHLNPMGDLELPAEIISRQLRKMETWPAVCVTAVLLAGASLVASMSVLAMVTEIVGFDEVMPMLFFSSAGVLLPMIVWLVGVRRFRKSCMRKPGWAGTLWRYHLYGLSLSLLVIAAVAVPVAPFLNRDVGVLPGTGGLYSGLVIGITIAFMVFILLAGRRIQRWANGDMETLQREVAVTLARDALRKALRREPRR
jgi:hypothetical protein